MFELGMRASTERTLLEISSPFLEDLRAAVGETVHLGVREGIEVVYLAKLAGRHHAVAPSRTGGRLALSCTALGKALLAHAPPDAFRDVVLAGLKRRTPRTVVAPGLLSRQLADVRRRGVSFEYEESRVGLACVAAPVFDGDGDVVAAVSVAGPVPGFVPERAADRVRGTAQAISVALARRTGMTRSREGAAAHQSR